LFHLPDASKIGKMISVFLPLLFSIHLHAEDLVPSANAALTPDKTLAPAPDDDALVRVQINGCDDTKYVKKKYDCHLVGSLIVDTKVFDARLGINKMVELNVTNVSGALVAAPGMLPISKEHGMEVHWFAGRLANSEYAGFMAPCDIDKSRDSIPRLDKTCSAKEPNSCTARAMQKEFVDAGYELLITKKVETIIFNVNKNGYMGMKNVARETALTIPNDPNLGPSCYFQYKKKPRKPMF
jgi:hypothetical protein